MSGEDVEIRVAEVPLERMAALGLGDYDEDTNTLEGDFSVAGKEYALRCVVDTVDHLPYYFNYRVFQLHLNIPIPKRQILILQNPMRPLTPAAQAFLDMLKQPVQESIGNGQPVLLHP